MFKYDNFLCKNDNRKTALFFQGALVFPIYDISHILPFDTSYPGENDANHESFYTH